MSEDKQFVDGMNISAPTERMPDFIKARLGVKVNNFYAWAQAHADERGWVNIDIKESKSGKWYAELNTYKKNADGEDVVPQDDSIDPESVPF